MSKAFLSQILKESVDLTGAAANRAAGDLMDAIVKELKKSGKFTLPSFGTFTVRKTKARKGLNPRTGESIKVKAGKTVRFKACPSKKSRTDRRTSENFPDTVSGAKEPRHGQWREV